MVKTAVIRAIYMAITFIAGLVLANIALPAHFGNISLLILNATFISLVTGLGTDSIVLYSVSGKKWTLSQSFTFSSTAFLLQAVLFVLLQALCYLRTSHTLLTQGQNDALFTEALYFTGIVLVERYTVLYYAGDLSRIANYVLLLSAIIYVALLFVMQYAGGMKVNSMHLVAGYSFIQGLCLAVVFHVHKKGLHFQGIQMSSVITAFKLSFLVVMTNLIQLAAYRADFWIIERFYSRYEVGVYAQANKFAALIWVLPGICSLLQLPKLASMQQKEVQALFRVFAVINAMVAAATVVVSWLFYSYYLSPQFREGGVPLYIMLPGYYCWSLVIFFSALFSSKGKFILNFYGSLLCFAVMLLCDLMLIPRYGLKGAAGANSLTYALLLLYYITLFKRTTAVPAGTLFRFRKEDIRVIGKWIN